MQFVLKVFFVDNFVDINNYFLIAGIELQFFLLFREALSE